MNVRGSLVESSEVRQETRCAGGWPGGMVVLALLEWAVDLSLVGRTVELAQSSYGALPAIFSILAGGVAFALLSRLTVQRIEKRDLSGDLSA